MGNWKKHTPNTRSNSYTREDIEKAVIRVYGEIYGKYTTIKYSENKKEHEPSISTVINRFDSWDDAKNSIIHTDDSVEEPTVDKSDEIVDTDSKPEEETEDDETEQVEEEKEDKDTTDDIDDSSEKEDEEDEPESTTDEKTDDEEEDKEDVEDEIDYNLSRQKCIRDVEEVAQKLNGKITAKDYVINRQSQHAKITDIKQHFDHWSNLRQEITIDKDPTEDYTRHECVKAIQKVASRVAYSPTAKDYDSERAENDPSADFIIAEYGEWEEALRDSELI